MQWDVPFQVPTSICPLRHVPVCLWLSSSRNKAIPACYFLDQHFVLGATKLIQIFQVKH